MDIAVIGAGAAGFFAAINCANASADNLVTIYEKSGKVLSKVRVSGGGRCNVTHACFDNLQLIENYPRGMKELRNAFARFSTTDTITWFESHGVKLKTEADGRMFPVTDNSETIINCLMDEALRLNIKIKLNHSVLKIDYENEKKFNLHLSNGDRISADKIIITTGGSATAKSYEWISDLGHSIIKPVPSLFTFNIPDSPLKNLEGISSIVTISIENFKYDSTGPLLITHWGTSGPAVLRMSAFAARHLHELNYNCKCFINWIPGNDDEDIRSEFLSFKTLQGNKKILSSVFKNIPSRLWIRICTTAAIAENERWADLNKAKINQLIQSCIRFPLSIKGKTTFKEEFVTCGGVDLKEIDMKTMRSKKIPGIYFAGEVLNIDGVTGGFNFQAAWTTGYLAGINCANSIN
jgi:predicted Rossmann fold flavoprotein